MPEFDKAKAYAAQEEVYFDDGREVELLEHILARPDKSSLEGSPEKVLQAIDEYGRTKKYLMNVGEDKGKIVTDLIANAKPKVMVELGGYVAYSSILFGAALRKAGGQQYYSLERSPEFARVMTSLIDLAGLSSIVKVIVGPSNDSLRKLHADGTLSKIDLLFLDHYKPAYLPDLKLCEEVGLVRPGTILAADNVIKPGNPPYLEYVRSSVEEKKRKAAEIDQKSGGDGVVHKSSEQDTDFKGDPSLVYQSELIKSFEPTGIPVRIGIRGIHVEEVIADNRLGWYRGDTMHWQGIASM